jgi:hypothetical protein
MWPDAEGHDARPIEIGQLRAERQRDPGWAITTIRSWVKEIGLSYVDSAAPGIHTRVGDLENPLKPNERQSLRCDHAAAVVGAIESTGIANCYVKGRWLYVWISD